MHKSLVNLIEIRKEINSKSLDLNSKVKIIAVSKTFSIDNILPLIDNGHLDFGENKVQEAVDKWTDIKNYKKDLKLHMIGKLQTNKVKQAVKLFDYIHSVDSQKLAKKIADEQQKINKKIKIFIQVNIGNEDQKSGINKVELGKLIDYCKQINLSVEGLMCIPPNDLDTSSYFSEMNSLNKNFNLSELSMGMSSDYLKASENLATYLRIGSKIFGQRS